MSYRTVRDLLTEPLRAPRVRSLEIACAQIADRPLPDILTDLRQVVSRPVSGEECRRLHVLVSTLYHRHRAGVPLPLTEELRAEIETAKSRHHHTEE